jgi:hypothetical protein
MAQTLVALAALSSPAVPANRATLAANMAALENLHENQLKAISIVALAYELNAGSGTNYLPAGVGFDRLAQDAAALFGGTSLLVSEQNQNMLATRTVLDWNGGKAAAAGLSTDVNALLAVSPGLLERSGELLTQMIFTLRYKLAE